MFHIAIFEITNECNLNCKYCYENMNKMKRASISVNDFAYFINHNRELFQDVILSGGEPFLNHSWIEFTTVLREQGIKINIITNGTEIDKILESQAKVDGLIISLDSFSGTYNLLRNPDKLCTKDKIIELKKSGLVQNIYIQVILNKLSAHEENLVDILTFCEYNEVGMKVKMMDIYDFNATEQYALSPKETEEIKTYLQEQSIIRNIDFDISIPSEYGNEFCDCSILSGYGNLRIRSDGSIFPCEKMDDERYKIGNLTDDKYKILASYKKVKNALLARVIKSAKTTCINCVYNDNCSKGCPVLHKMNRSIDECKKGIACEKNSFTI